MCSSTIENVESLVGEGKERFVEAQLTVDLAAVTEVDSSAPAPDPILVG